MVLALGTSALAIAVICIDRKSREFGGAFYAITPPVPGILCPILRWVVERRTPRTRQ